MELAYEDEYTGRTGCVEVPHDTTCHQLLVRICDAEQSAEMFAYLVVDGEQLPQSDAAVARFGVSSDSKVVLTRTVTKVLQKFDGLDRWAIQRRYCDLPEWAQAHHDVVVGLCGRLPGSSFGLFLQCWPKYVLDSTELLVRVVLTNTNFLRDLIRFLPSHGLGDDREFLEGVLTAKAADLATAFRRCDAVVMAAGSDLRDDIAFARLVLAIQPKHLPRFSDAVRGDCATVLPLMRVAPGLLRHASPALRDNREVVLAAVAASGACVGVASARLRDDVSVRLTAAASSGVGTLRSLAGAPAEREVVVAAVRESGRALQYAPALAADREVALEALRQTPAAGSYVAASLRADADFVREAVGLGMPLRFVAEPLLTRSFVLESVRANGLLLGTGAQHLCADREVVLAAVAQNGSALEAASKALRADKEVVCAAVASVGTALRCAAKELRDDGEVARIALRRSLRAWKTAGPKVRADPDVQEMCRSIVAERKAARQVAAASGAEGEGGEGGDDCSSCGSFDFSFA